MRASGCEALGFILSIGKKKERKMRKKEKVSNKIFWRYIPIMVPSEKKICQFGKCHYTQES
jgi:hypothetical protein